MSFKNNNSYFLYILVLLSFIQIKQARASEQFIQFGLEYDSNVYKNFGSQKKDFAFRGHYMNQKQVIDKNKFKSYFFYQQGVKKFFKESNQDQIIQSFSLSTRYQNKKFRFEWRPSLKVLIERKTSVSDNFDVEEDYVLPALNMRALYEHQNTQYVLDFGARLFQFYANDNFSNVSEWLKFTIDHKLSSSFEVGLSYMYSLEQFLDVSRNDDNHDLTVYIIYPYKPNIKMSYTYADSNSSINSFSFVKHQAMFRVFYDVGERSSGIPYLSLYASGVLQWSEFPSIFSFDDEGQRFLLSESEGQTFNSFIGKLSYYMSEKQHLELKYTRFSNDLSSQQNNYDRSIYYIGFKQRF